MELRKSVKFQTLQLNLYIRHHLTDVPKTKFSCPKLSRVQSLTDYQQPDCFPEQQAAINEGTHLSLHLR